MPEPTPPEDYKHLEIPNRVQCLPGNGGLTRLLATSPGGEAEVYLHGAHVTRFRKTNGAPLLFISDSSLYAPHKAIRGGIPLIFPWFGARPGEAMHGFARTMEWELNDTTLTPEDAVRLSFRLPGCPERASSPPFEFTYTVTVGETLTLETTVRNLSETRDLPFEICLHTYFAVADSRQIRIRGLQGHDYLDKADQFARKTETAGAIAIAAEVDRIYLDAAGPVEIDDPGNQRRIRVEKYGSRSTVVWNPWIDKGHAMDDFGDNDHLRMVCVESGNVGDNQIRLPPDETATLGIILSERT